MCDKINSCKEEKPFKMDETEVEAGCKTQPINEGDESHDAPQSFLSKIKLIQFVNDPCWRRNRLILVVASLLGLVALYVIATCIVITLSPPRSDPRCPRKWFDKETVYEILPESFQDTSSKAANGAAKKGDGVGDIKGKIDTIFNNRIVYIK